MTATHFIPELDRKGLRDFGLVTGAIVAVLFGLFFPWLLERPWPRWPWVLFGVLGGLGLVAPLALRPVYHVWMRFGLLLSRVTTPLILGIVFYLVISPLGLLRRLGRHDAMARSFDAKAGSYRVPSREKPSNHLERPF
jgi:Saxitoxin biosynthesis operon protein SxtJ